MGQRIVDCRQYGPSFVLTIATIVDGDTVKYIVTYTLLLPVLYIALARDFANSILNSKQNPFNHLLMSCLKCFRMIYQCHISLFYSVNRKNSGQSERYSS